MRPSLNYDIASSDEHTIFAAAICDGFNADPYCASSKRNLTRFAIRSSANLAKSVNPAELIENPRFVQTQKFCYIAKSAICWFDDLYAVRPNSHADLSCFSRINEAVVETSTAKLYRL
jgi:hypothetical protein